MSTLAPLDVSQYNATVTSHQRASSFVEVNLSMLRENMTNIEALAKGSKVLPMVKGNAYGNGIIPISMFLSLELGYSTLGVASLGEALEILENVKGFTDEGYDRSDVASVAARTSINGRRHVVVFSDTELHNDAEREKYKGRPLIPVLQSVADVERFVAEPMFASVPCWVKLNTGMNRLGLSPEEFTSQVVPILVKAQRSIDLLLTHFSNADSLLEECSITDQQVEAFNAAHKAGLEAGLVIKETSCSNSGGITQGVHLGETNQWVRSGLMMYGPSAVEHPKTGELLWRGHQISSWKTKIVDTHWYKKGDSIGYGVQPLPYDAYVVVLPLGYADGFVKYYTGCTVTINGVDGKVHGNVCMDLCFVAFPADVIQGLPEDQVPKPEQSVDIWTHDNRSIQRMSNEVGTNTYSLMCCVSIRIPRVYVK